MLEPVCSEGSAFTSRKYQTPASEMRKSRRARSFSSRISTIRLLAARRASLVARGSCAGACICTVSGRPIFSA